MHLNSQRGNPILDLPQSQTETTTLLQIGNAAGKQTSY